MAEVLLHWIQVSRDADHDRIGPAGFQIPEIVVDPVGRFDDDGADDAGWLRQRAIHGGKHGFGDGAIGRRTHVPRAQGAGTVEEMNVRIDNGDAVYTCRLGMSAIQRRDRGYSRGARQKRAPAQAFLHGFVLPECGHRFPPGSFGSSYTRTGAVHHTCALLSQARPGICRSSRNY